MKIVVAGAGLAGLTAARALGRRRAAVTVLDARDRLGGRVRTVRSEFGPDEYGELGGEFIDAAQKEIRSLCGELGLPLTRVLQSGFTHRYRGNDGAYHVSRMRAWHELEELVSPLLTRYRLARGNPDSEAVKEMATLSLREWLRRRPATPQHHSMADALRGFFLADPDDVSVVALVEQLATGGSPAQAEMYRVAGGNDRLVEALARDADARVLLRHRVVAIAQPVDRVVITVVDEAGRQHELEADAVVLTLPASTLADVSITPPLPDDQAHAIRTLRYGCATKLLMRTAVDSILGRARAFATDAAVGAFWQCSDHVLTFLAGGSASRALRVRVDGGAQRVLEELCWLGDVARSSNAQIMHSTTWEDDPFARGGYAYFDAGFDPAARPLLGRRAGRIHFAGEHTSTRWQGYMNGAVETALRVVEELTTN